MTDGAQFFEGLDEARTRADEEPAAETDRALRLLTGITDLLNSPIDRFDQVQEEVLEATIRITGADRGLLMLLGPKGDLEVRLAKNLKLDMLPAGERQISQTIVSQVVRSGKSVLIPDLAEADDFADSASVHALRLLSVMCVPLRQRIERRGSREGGRTRAETKVIGAVYVDSRSVKTSFQSKDLALFEALASVATTAIVHAVNFRHATIDELSGLVSRRYLERRIEDEVDLARRRKEGALSALLIDIDHLREVNHSRGYAAGDRVIQTVGRVLRQRTRRQDTCGRYGGEEFVVVLPDTDKRGAEEVARKLLVALQREGVQVSVGVATWQGPDEAPGQLIRRCDQALSQAKADGGGRARPYADDLASVMPSTDKLAGIFSGDAATVYRNVLMLLESIPRIHQGGTVDQVLERVVESVIDLSRAERGLLFLCEEGRTAPRFGQDWRRHRIEPEGYEAEVVTRVLEKDEALELPGASEEVPAVICVPISARGGGSTEGAIYLEARGAAFREGSLAFALEFARQAAFAIENARLLDENRAYAGKIEKLMRALEQEREQLAKERELEEASRNAAGLVPATAASAAPAARPSTPPRDAPIPAEPSAAPAPRYGRIIGGTEPMLRVYKMLERVTHSTIPVFIHGESGTGKELVAQAIHFHGPRRAARFVAENCAAMTESLLESELFGYVKGAFTGAQADRPGLFEVADGGTLFLDEVGDMTPAMQTKLLRVLQEGEVRRVGGKHPIQVDVRMISASNKDIQLLVEQHQFREDLYYRLNVVRIDLPPLRDRRGDVPDLVDHFLRDDGRLPAPRKAISDAAMEVLLRYPFPGNVRELRNVIERAKILAEGATIDVDAILLDGEWPSGAGPAPDARRRGGPPPPRAQSPLASDERTQPPGLAPGSKLEACYFELNERQRKLVEYLQSYGAIKNRDYYEIMGVSKSTGWRDLKDLMDKGLIRVAGKGKGSVYSLDPSAEAPVD